MFGGRTQVRPYEPPHNPHIGRGEAMSPPGCITRRLFIPARFSKYPNVGTPCPPSGLNVGLGLGQRDGLHAEQGVGHGLECGILFAIQGGIGHIQAVGGVTHAHLFQIA